MREYSPDLRLAVVESSPVERMPTISDEVCSIGSSAKGVFSSKERVEDRTILDELEYIRKLQR